MILETTAKNAEVVSTGFESVNMGIDNSDMSVLMMLLSEGLYSDPIGSIVREYTSNALDSHIEAGITKPIVVSLKREGDTWVFGVEDFGVGLSEERVDNIFSKYAASTKRNTDTQLGMFGLGSKSALGYRDNFFIRSRYEGQEYLYMMSKGEKSTMLTLLSQSDTTEENGVKITVPLLQDHHYSEFLSSIKEQLCYFEGVYFDVYNASGMPMISNDFKIVKHPLWKYSGLNQYTSLHLSLGNVCYPLDYQKLGIKIINFPIALNFGLDSGLRPVPNREQLMYTPDAKKIIMDRIKEVALYFQEKFNETVTEKESFFDAFRELDPSYSRMVEILPSKFMHLSNLKDFVDSDNYKKVTIKGMTHIDPYRLYANRFHLIENWDYVGSVGPRNLKKYSRSPDNNFTDIKNGRGLVLGKEMTPKQKRYIIDTKGEVPLFRQSGKIPLKSDDTYKVTYQTLLQLHKVEEKEWRLHIAEFNKVQKELLSKIGNTDDYQPTEAWLLSQKKTRASYTMTTVEKTEVNPAIARNAGKGWWLDCTFESGTAIDVTDADNIYVYGRKAEKEKLTKVWQVFKVLDTKTFKVAMLGDRDYKRVQGQKRWLTIKEFMEGEYPVFGKACTLLVCKNLMKDEVNKVAFENTKFVGFVDGPFAGKLAALNSFVTDKHTRTIRIEDVPLVEDMLAICEEKNLWTPEYETYLEVKEKIGLFSFMSKLGIGSSYNGYDKDAIEIAKEIYAYRKQQELITTTEDES